MYKETLERAIDDHKPESEQSMNSNHSFEAINNLKNSSEDVDSNTTETQSLQSLMDALPAKIKTSERTPLWENKQLLCWLDSILSLLALNTTIKNLEPQEKSLLKIFYDELNFIKSIFKVKNKYQSVKERLNELRDNLLKFLHPKMMLNFNVEEDSPLLSFQLILKTSPKLCEELEWEYSIDFNCKMCQFKRKDK